MTGPLALDVRLRRGTLDLEVEVHVAPGEVVAVVGPNGAGKSTLVDLVAGLLRPERGTVALGGRVVEDVDAGTHVPSQDRRLGVVLQQLALFPSLTVLENVAFGPVARGVDRRLARRTATTWLAAVGLADVAHVRPAALSGGQAQRVALARALACDPAALLLDEPTAAQDVTADLAVRRLLATHLAGFAGPTLLVTHDPLEALTLADRLVVLEAGRVVQVGTPAEVARHPRSAWAARLVGLNRWTGTAADGVVTLPSGGTVAVRDRTVTGPAQAVVHPRAVALHATPPGGSPRNAWRGTVTGLDQQGDHVRVELDGPVPVVAAVTAATVAEMRLHPGVELWAVVKATEVDALPL